MLRASPFLVVAFAAAALGSAVAGAGTSVPECGRGTLDGVFAAVPGSGAAGQISYALRLRNRSANSCFVTGMPGLRLLDRAGRPLPTHVAPAQPGVATAVRVVLAPGARAVTTARFSPDVPGVGEPVGRTCERRAYRVRVLLPATSFVVPLRPPTPVCEHGRMLVSVLVAAR
jgi:hypothetical protein